MRTKNIPLILLLAFSISSFAQDGSNLFDESFVHEIRISSDYPSLIDTLIYYNDMPDMGEGNIYLPVNVSIDGNALSQVGVRIKGFSSSWDPLKKPLRLDFNEFVSGQHYDGMKKLSLNNAFMDPSYMRDAIAFNIMRTAGVKASRTAYAKVYLDNVYWGVYIMVEQIDKTFIGNYFDNDEGNLFKCMHNSNLSYNGDDPGPYDEIFDLKTNETENDWSGFIDFVRTINKIGISDDEFETEFPKIFNIDDYLKVLAVDVLTLNWDSYYNHGRNFYIYEDTETGKFHWIPWDYSFSFSSSATDILAKNNNEEKPLIRNLLKSPRVLNKFLLTYQSILEDNFTSERIEPIIDQYKALIRADLELDPRRSMSMEAFDRSLEENTWETVRDTIRQQFDMRFTYIVDSQQQIPDSILNSGKAWVDTVWFTKWNFDTLQIDNEEVVMLNTSTYTEWTMYHVGLKSFVKERIEQVNAELDEFDIFPVAVEDDLASNGELGIYPNPSSTHIRISGHKLRPPFQIKIFDLHGKEVYHGFNETEISTVNLASGMYVLKAMDGQSVYHTTFAKTK